MVDHVAERGGGARRAPLQESLALARAVGEPWLIGHALYHALLRVANSAAVGRAGERAYARAAGEEGIRLLRAAGDTMAGARARFSLGQVALYEGDYERARAAFVDCLPMLRAQRSQSFLADGLVSLADVARGQGDYGEATALYAEGLALYRAPEDRWLPAVAGVLSRLAAFAFERGEWAVAQAHLAQSLTIARDTGHVGAPVRAPELAGVFEVGAALAAVQGAPGRAVRLAGVAAAQRAHLKRPATAAEQATLEGRLTSARQVLSAAEHAAAWAEGQAMTPEQAIDYALEEPPPA